MTIVAEIIMAIAILLFIAILFYFGLVYSPERRG